MKKTLLMRMARRHPAAAAAAFAATVALGACTNGTPPPPSPAMAPTELAAVDTPKPDYPIELICAGISGTTVLTATIDTAGKPTRLQLTQSSGNEALDKSAMERVPSWKFAPATRNGKPVPQTIQIPVNFKPPAVRPDECFALDARSQG